MLTKISNQNKMKYIIRAIRASLMTLTVNPSNSFNVQTLDEAAIDTIVENWELLMSEDKMTLKS